MQDMRNYELYASYRHLAYLAPCKDVLKATYEFGITVKSIVFDGLAANIGMTAELGANL